MRHQPRNRSVHDAPPLEVDQAAPELVELVARCLEKSSEERPTAAEAAETLRDLLQPGRTKLKDEANPFRGLLPFAERNADLFFGRDAEVDAFIERLAARFPGVEVVRVEVTVGVDYAP